MRRLKLLTLTLTICVSTLFSVTAISDTETNTLKRELLIELASAQSESEAHEAEGKLWQFWFNQAPNKEVRKIFDAGQERLRAYDFEAAENYFDKVIEAAPEYAEGYNQRAFARFLRDNYEDSLTDLEKAVVLEPHHFGAMAGMYRILRSQNRTSVAMEILRRAVTIHPWLKERSALPKDMWPEAYRRLHEPGLEI